MFQKLQLASASPRRKEILENLGFVVEINPAHIDETPHPDETAENYVRRMAEEKNRAVQNQQNLPVVSADTAVILDHQILGKPNDHQDAKRLLQLLSGREHIVLTAVCVSFQQHYLSDISKSTVLFTPLSDKEIETYIQTGEPMDKAGAYGIQGKGGMFVQHLSGSFTGVMGLPVFETGNLLKILYEKFC